jgi:putative oxidoreductase
MKQNTPQDIGLLVMRIVLGCIGIYYGSNKLGLFHGAGFEGTVEFMRHTFGISKPFAILAIVAELGGGIGVLLGLFTRLAAFGMMCTLAVAAFETVNKQGSLSAVTNGRLLEVMQFAYPLVVGTLAFGILMIGPGAYCLDAKLFNKGGAKK